MTGTQYIGVAMVVALFAGLFILICVEDGLKTALKVYGLVAGLVAFISVAAFLIAVKS